MHIHHKIINLILIPLSIYTIICFLLFLFQENLIYFPNKSNSYNQIIAKPIIMDNEIIGLESNDNNSNVIIVFHGNAGNANDRLFYQKLFPKNYHLIIMEYPGYGLNNNEEINKNFILDKANKLMNYAKNKYGNNITLLGESLGTGIASNMAKKHNIDKLILVTPYNSILQIAQDKFWYFPIKILLTNNYDNNENLTNYSGKVLFVISEYDRVILPKYAFQLYENFKGNKEKLYIQEAGHNNWVKFMTIQQLEILNEFIINKI